MTQPRRAWMALATAYFALSGAIALLLTIGQAWGALSAGLAGCALFVGDAFLRLPVSADSLGCTQHLDLGSIVLGAVASVVLLATLAWLVGRRGTALTRLAPLGAVVAVLVGLLPAATVLWFVEFYRGSLGPVEIGVGLVPLAWSVSSALIVLAVWRAQQQRAPV